MKKGIAVILAVILILAGLAVAWATWRPGSGRTASYQEHTLELPAGQYDSLTVEELTRDIQVRPSEDRKHRGRPVPSPGGTRSVCVRLAV